jgi:hypothetical protein
MDTTQFGSAFLKAAIPSRVTCRCRNASSLSSHVHSGDDAFHNPVGVELPGGPIPHTVAIHRLGFFNGLHEDSQTPHVIVRFRTLASGRQSVFDYACFASPDVAAPVRATTVTQPACSMS